MHISFTRIIFSKKKFKNQCLDYNVCYLCTKNQQKNVNDIELTLPKINREIRSNIQAALGEKQVPSKDLNMVFENIVIIVHIKKKTHNYILD